MSAVTKAASEHDRICVPVAEAKELSLQVLSRHGVPPTHAIEQVDLLLEAELRGRPSHGLLRLNRVVERIRNGVTNPYTRGRHNWRASALLDVDGEMGLGPVVALAALEQLTVRARESGVAVAAIHNNNHLGMLAWYVERVAAAGQLAVVFTTSEALVHPWGGRKAMIGTNPIAIGVPAKPHPFVLDMATGLVSMGKIHDYAHRGEPIPPDWALDANGNPTTDAVAAKSGAIAPFGEAKGYALALGFEVLVSALTGAALGTAVRGTLDSSAVCNKGDVLMVMTPHSDVAEQVTDYLSAVRMCAPIAADTAVKIPGDRMYACRSQRLADGIPVAIDVWTQLVALASDHAVQ